MITLLNSLWIQLMQGIQKVTGKLLQYDDLIIHRIDISRFSPTC